MSEKATREPGYYWVKDKHGNEKIAELVNEGQEPAWLQMGSRLEITGDQHWIEIDERRIDRNGYEALEAENKLLREALKEAHDIASYRVNKREIEIFRILDAALKGESLEK